MQQYIIHITFIIWIILVILSIYFCGKPNKKIIDKYGNPIKHICGHKCFNSMPVRSFNNTIFIDIYKDFLVISVGNEEIILNKDFQQFKIYGSYTRSVFEIDYNNKILQICIFAKEAKMLEKWFERE